MAVISAYRRWISPLTGARCRFHPTCSAYAVTAVTDHGARRGVWLAMERIARCHPWNPGGIDPVPEKEDRLVIAPAVSAGTHHSQEH